jgi:hypothetical protein
VPLLKLREEKTRQVHLYLNADSINDQQLAELKTLLQSSRGSCSTWLHLKIPMRSETVLALGDHYSVQPSDEFLTRVERLFGERVAVLR